MKFLGHQTSSSASKSVVFTFFNANCFYAFCFLFSNFLTLSSWYSFFPPQPTFQFCGRFSDKNVQSAAKWLEKLEWELPPFKVDEKISSHVILEIIDLFTIEEVAA